MVGSTASDGSPCKTIFIRDAGTHNALSKTTNSVRNFAMENGGRIIKMSTVKEGPFAKASEGKKSSRLIVKFENGDTAQIDIIQGESEKRFSVYADDGRDMFDDSNDVQGDARAVYDAWHNSDGSAKSGYMLAPNGKPTNLTERQWIQVRTPAFKRWFGDWESLAETAYMRIVKSVSEAVQAIRDAGLLNQDIFNYKLGIKARISGANLSKMESEKATSKSVSPRLHALAVANVDKLFASASIEMKHPDTHGRNEVEGIRRIGTVMRDPDDGLFVPVMLTVVEYRQYGKKIYTVETVDVGKYKNPAGQLADSPTNGDTQAPIAEFVSKIAKLAEEVNHSDVSKVVDENGEPKVVYHGTPHGGHTVFNGSKNGSYSYSVDDTTFFSSSQNVAMSYSTDPKTKYSDLPKSAIEDARRYIGSSHSEVRKEDNGRFYVYLDGEYVANSDADTLETALEKAAVSIASSMEKNQDSMTYSVFLSVKNPVAVDFNGGSWRGERSADGYYDNSVPIIAERAKMSGHDGLIVKNVQDAANILGRGIADDYAVFSPSQIKSATDNNGAFDNTNPDIRYSLVTDEAKIKELEEGDTMKVYRAMQLVDGKLYPPMSGKINGKWREPIQLGKWEQSEERPDLIGKDGKFKLNKGNGSTIGAAYNPYFHTSTSPLNDQFSSAYKRPELVTVEVEIPVSELTSGYKAKGAKDAVGKVDWHSGSTTASLGGRDVYLSRYDKPIRIVPESEVAKVIAERARGKNITFKTNTVTPKLKEALKAEGLRFDDDIRYSIGGVRGASALGISGVADAEAMEKDGIDREDIWRKTGWWRGKDGKWRVEIPDVKRKAWHGDPEERHFTGGGDDFYRYKLTEMVRDNGLFDAYPSLKKIKVEFHKNMPANIGGNFNEETLTIKMPQKFHLTTDWAKEGLGDGKSAELNEAGRKTIVHELQHAIQLFEGLAKGGSPTEPVRPYALDDKTGHALSVFSEAVGMDPTNAGELAIIAYWAKKIASDQIGDDVPKRLAEKFETAAKEAGKTPQEFRDEIERFYDSKTETPMGQYFKLEGEVEARNVQTRLGMTPEERAATPPWETEDVPADRQIVRFSVTAEDDAGNVIPLSQRFNRKNTDIRYSVQSMSQLGEQANAAIRELSTGKDAVIHNSYGDITYGIGETGKLTANGRIKGGWGLMHIVYSRMAKDGATLNDALDIAMLVADALENGTESEVRHNKHYYQKDGIEAVFAINQDTSKPVLTGYRIREDESDGAILASHDLRTIPPPRKEDVVASLAKRIALLSNEGQASRFSVSSAADAAYMDAVNRGDMETAQRMVDDAFDKSEGYRDETGEYHYRESVHAVGYRIGRIPDGGRSYNTRDGRYEEGVSLIGVGNLPPVQSFAISALRDAGAKIVYLEGDVLTTTGGDDEFLITNAKPITRETFDKALRTDAQKIAEKTLADKKWDTLSRIDSYRDATMKWANAAKAITLDPVTYDDNGNVIPLSQRFNSRNSDIRFSINIPEAGLSRAEAKAAIDTLKGKSYTNRETGISARLSSTGAGKLISNAATGKTQANGFSKEQHNALAAMIDELFENAYFISSKPDDDGDKNIASIKRFVCPVTVADTEAGAYITIKESVQHGHRIYSVEGIKIEELSPMVRRVIADRNAADSSSSFSLPKSAYGVNPEEQNRDIQNLYIQASQNIPMLKDIAYRLCVKSVMGTASFRLPNREENDLQVKKRDKIIEKANLLYGGDVSQVVDIIAATVTLSPEDSYIDTLSSIDSETG